MFYLFEIATFSRIYDGGSQTPTKTLKAVLNCDSKMIFVSFPKPVSNLCQTFREVYQLSLHPKRNWGKFKNTCRLKCHDVRKFLVSTKLVHFYYASLSFQILGREVADHPLTPDPVVNITFFFSAHHKSGKQTYSI